MRETARALGSSGVLALALVLALPGAARAQGVENAAPTTGAATRSRQGPELERRAVELKQVSEKLVCQCGCNMILSECSHQSCPFALPQRQKISAALESGKGESEIIAAYVRDYGKGVLAIPPTEGSLARRFAWFAPYIALALGGIAVVVYLFRITRKRTAAGPASGGGSKPGGAPGPGASGQPDGERERFRRQIEEELGGPAGAGR